MFQALISNVIEVLFLCGFVSWIDLYLNKKHSHFVLGVLYGLITIMVIQSHIMVVEGWFFDFRYIAMTMAGFTGGPVTAVIATLISSLYRYNVGGSGSMGGIMTIIIFASFGIILSRCIKNRQNGKKILFWFMIGIVMAILLIVTIASIPWQNNSAKVLRVFAAPYLMITPFATTIIFNFYFWTRDFVSKGLILNTIINSSPINLMIFDTHGPILSSKSLQTELLTNPYLENPNLLLDQDKTCLNATKRQCKELATEDERHLIVDLTSIPMPGGEYACVAIVNDITEMRQMETERVEQLTKRLELEKKLSQSNQLIADIINNMSDGFYALDDQWRFTFVNKKSEELFQKTRAELLGKVLWLVDPQARGTLLDLNFRKATIDCSPMTFEYISSLQKYSWYQITISPTQFGLSVYYRDITEQKLSREKLIKSQEKMATILESMTDCFYAMDQDLKFTYINRAAEVAFGKSRNELLGKKMIEVFEANDTALLHYNKVISEKKAVTFEIISEALGDKWLELSVYPTETGVTCYFRDITTRKKTEETLRQSEEKFSKAFHGGPIMMTLATVEEGKFIDANEALCSGIGYTREEIIGRTANELNLFVDMNKRREHGKRLMEQKRLEKVELDFRTKSGEIRHGLSWSQLFYLEGKPCHITGLIDVTEQKLIQKEMSKLDRLNLVGQLAAGIAHEIRNPMTTVRGYLQLLGAKPGYAAQKSTFELMISELDRANSIITEFLSLAQTKQSELKSQNLNDIINYVYPLLEADTFTQNRQISFIPGEIPNLELNGKEITQLVLNLARNGLEAMEKDGCLTIQSYLEDGLVVLTIADEGSGIAPENISKVGTPFFTTKDNGTGLGLATSYKIAESHNAEIQIDSSPTGTTFFILFTIPDKEQEQKKMIV